MKKVLALMVMVALLGGCASTSFMCKNKDAIMTGLQLVINQANSVIDAIKAQYPDLVPAAVQDIINKAQQAKDAASAAMSQACPVVTDLTNAQQSMTMATQKMAMAGMKVGR